MNSRRIFSRIPTKRYLLEPLKYFCSMVWEVTPESAVDFTKRSMYLAFCWPPPRNSTKRDMQMLNILWWISFLSSITLLGPLITSIYEFRRDALIVTKSTLFSLAIANFAIKMIVCKLNRQRTQKLIYEMDDYLKAAKSHDRIILQNYVDRCATLHSTLTIIYYFTTAAVVCGPFILPQTFPTPAIYPFPVDSTFVFIVIYIHQAFVGFQCSTGLTIDCQSALLLWFTGARFQILADNATRVNKLSFHDFVKEHQHLLNYADDVKYVTRYVVLTTAMMTGLGTAFSGLQLISPQPMAVKIQFLAVALSAAMNLYTCAWPADNLASVVSALTQKCIEIPDVSLEKKAHPKFVGKLSLVLTVPFCPAVPFCLGLPYLLSSSIGNSLYNSPWPSSSTKMIKNYLFVIRRSQKATVVTVGGFVPVLSLQYYGSFLSTAFSYFTTLRMSMDVENSEI